MDHNDQGLRPVLSVYGFDTIIYGWNLRHYLLREFDKELGLRATYYDKEYQEEFTDLIMGIPELDALQKIRLADADIPYWKEVITYYDHPDKPSWQGFWVDWTPET